MASTYVNEIALMAADKVLRNGRGVDQKPKLRTEIGACRVVMSEWWGKKVTIIGLGNPPRSCLLETPERKNQQASIVTLETC